MYIIQHCQVWWKVRYPFPVCNYLYLSQISFGKSLYHYNNTITIRCCDKSSLESKFHHRPICEVFVFDLLFTDGLGYLVVAIVGTRYRSKAFLTPEDLLQHITNPLSHQELDPNGQDLLPQHMIQPHLGVTCVLHIGNR